jgi:hypothetical protein
VLQQVGGWVGRWMQGTHNSLVTVDTNDTQLSRCSTKLHMSMPSSIRGSSSS